MIGNNLSNGVQPLVAGIDLGSLCTKSVITDLKGKVLSYSIIRSGSIYVGAAEASFSQALKKAGLSMEQIGYIVSTGYGRDQVPFANMQITEITCHARGVTHIFPDVHTIIDIGGQDSKVIHLNNEGEVNNFVMNDRCAAGTGRFLEVMAGALDSSLEEMGEIWLKSTKQVEVSSVCTVFAESEVISLIASGGEKADIMAAIFRAVARRTSGLVAQLGIRENVAMTGGVAKNNGIVYALEKKLGIHFHIPEEPQIIGAWGAALIAIKRLLSQTQEIKS
jgi:predicted CoA-substrate-specific enzyme activase